MARKHRWVALPRLPEVRVALARPGLGASDLAHALGRSRQHISEVLNGSRTSVRVATEIAEYLGRDLDDLFFVVDLENPPNEASAA